MSQAMQLAFIKPKPFDPSQGSIWAWLFLALSVVFALLSWQHYFSVERQLHLSEQTLQQAMAVQPRLAQQQAAQAASQTLALPKQQIRMIRKTVDQLLIPWQDLFHTFESIQHKQIALLELSPSQQKQMIVIRGEARDLEDIFAYIRALEKADALNKVYLQSHHVDKTDAQKPVEFTLHADWKVSQ